MKQSRQELYCYVDETGQDTKGKLFIVSVVITKEDRSKIYDFLEKIERESGKKKTKWIRTKKELKIGYLDEVLQNKLFQHKIYYSVSADTTAYKEVTLITIASAITSAKDRRDYKASIFIDGLYKSEVPRVGASLRRIGIHTEKIRGVNDQTDAIIRLADAISGLMREWTEGIDYAQKLYALGAKNKTVTRV